MYSPERKALRRFVTLFVALNSIFLILISLMYYYYQKNIFTELRYDSMTHYAQSQLSHIYGSKTSEELQEHLHRIQRDPRFEVGFLDSSRNVVYTSDPNLTFPFVLGISEYRNHYYYIDRVALDNLKTIRYIVVRAQTIEPQLTQTRRSIYLIVGFSIVFLSLVVYALSRLFLLPVREVIARLDRFIRDTTHELNTPLSVITMSVEQLRKATQPPELAKHISRIDVASRTISHLYDDLTYLLLHEKSKKGDTPPLDLRNLLEERIEYFRPIAEAKRVTIHSQLDNTQLAIERDKMIRLIDNLLSNAIKYNKPGGNVTIRLDKSSFEVEDTGIGIPDDKLSLIFNRYVRFDDASGGFGIGLNIIRTICNESNLTVSVDSKVAEGSIFRIRWEKVHTNFTHNDV